MRYASRWTLAVALSWFAGCGGKAVVDGTGSGGQAGSDSTGTTTSTSSTTSTSTAGTGCDTVCSALGSSPWCGSDATCLSACAAAQSGAGACAAELAAALSCIAAQAGATNCWFPSDCQVAIAQYGNCLGFGGACGGADCQGDSQNCSCTTSCGSGIFDVECHYSDLQVDCWCRIQGVPVGICAGSGNDPCDPSGCCCHSYF